MKNCIKKKYIYIYLFFLVSHTTTDVNSWIFSWKRQPGSCTQGDFFIFIARRKADLIRAKLQISVHKMTLYNAVL